MANKAAFYNLPGTEGYEGSWRQYIQVKYRNVIVYPDCVQFDQISSSFVNPQTVGFFWHELQKANHRAVIQDAAGSSLARMFIKLCNHNNIEIINIVRYEKEVEELLDFGAKHVLASESPTFNEDLEVLIAELHPTGFYDCIGGRVCSDIFIKMPIRSILYIYGDQAGGEECSIPYGEITESRKTITSINMTDFTDLFLSDEERQYYFNTVREDISNGGEIFGTKVICAFPIDKFTQAIEQSAITAGIGKVVLHPQE